MAFSGAGVFSRIHSWIADRDNGVKITAVRHDAEDDGFATGLSNTICRDGQSTITASIPFSAQKITDLGNATADADALNRITADGRLTNHGECYLSYSSTTVLRLDPYNGNQINISGTRQVIPAAGVSYTASGMTAGRMYVYAWMDAATMKLETSLTAYTVNSTTGIHVKSGDATRTLVGLAVADSATTFLAQTVADITVLSLFNRRRRTATATNAVPGFSATSFTAVVASDSTFLTWSGVEFAWAARGTAGSGTNLLSTTAALDGTAVTPADTLNCYPSTQAGSLGITGQGGGFGHPAAEGVHTYNLHAAVNAGTFTVTGGISIYVDG